MTAIIFLMLLPLPWYIVLPAGITTLLMIFLLRYLDAK